LALFAALLSIALATPPARAACDADGSGGIGGTGQAPKGKQPGSRGNGKDRGGIGGTGRAERDPGGIGGTGIVGVITGFGSVCVNGLEIAYDAATPVDGNGEPADANALAVGQVVVIEARERGGALHADRIAVRDAAVGPIGRSDPTRNEIEVLGQRVRIDPATRIDAGAALRSGDFVAVSGLRREDGSVAATRIDAARPSERVSVTGPMAQGTRSGARVGELVIELPQGVAPADLGERVVLAIGRIDPRSGALQADRVEPAVRFDAKPERLSIEGLVQRAGAKGFRTEHGEVDASGLGARTTPSAGTRVIVNGTPDASGRLQADRIDLVSPERPPSPDSERPKRDPATNRPHDRDEHGAPGKIDEPETAEKPERPEQRDESERPEKAEAIEHPEKPEKPEKIEKPETPERVEHPDAPEIERPEKPETPEVERPETPELPEIERHEVERPETPELPEIERPELERPEAPEIPEIERPEFERPEIEVPEIEAPEPPELPEIERPEHDD
jgi:hypothetical protein